MAKIPDIRSALISSNANEMITNSKKRRTFLYCYFGSIEKGYYLVEGMYVTEKDFNKMFPVESKPIRRHGSNIDTTKF